jgi:hypothetical protein
MAYRRSNRDGNSTKIIDFLLILGILAGLGYMVYFHPETVTSLKNWVGLGAPEATNASMASAPMPPPLLPVPMSPVPATIRSTNEINNPPLVGRPRPALPEQDHWTWTTTEGKTYQDVKIEKIEGEYVTVLHADGGARILISTLPDTVQKELDYYSAQTQ